MAMQGHLSRLWSGDDLAKAVVPQWTVARTRSCQRGERWAGQRVTDGFASTRACAARSAGKGAVGQGQGSAAGQAPVSAGLAGPCGHRLLPILVTVPIGVWVARLVFALATHVVFA